MAVGNATRTTGHAVVVRGTDLREPREQAMRHIGAPSPDTIARTVAGFCAAYGVGKTMAYELIERGVLQTKKAGKRTLILEDSAIEWLNSLPRGGKHDVRSISSLR